RICRKYKHHAAALKSRRPSLNKHRHKPAQNEQPDNLRLRPGGSDRKSSEDDPEKQVSANGCAHQLDHAPHDDRDNSSTDPVEHALNPGQAAKMDVQGSYKYSHKE